MTTTAKSTTDGMELRERIDRFLREQGLDGAATRVVPLTGDASDRRYFRVIRPDGEPLVLAAHVGPIEFASLPFANVADLLRQMPVPAPGIVGHSDPLGIVALEDLGDVTLQAHLGAVAAAEHAASYREAVRLIDVMQRRGADIEPGAYLPYRIAFDVEKLTWELDFFVKHFVEGYRGAVLTAAERTALGSEWATIAAELAAEPRVFCHRDYHSRNLMVHAGRLYIIDFQDARMGPDTYDLASLLRDSYVDLEDQQVNDLIAYFLAWRDAQNIQRTPRNGFTRSDETEFRRRFDLMALQRNLKALGTFGYQTVTRRNPVYIQYMPRTLRYARTNLDKYARFSRLRELLVAHVEELR